MSESVSVDIPTTLQWARIFDLSSEHLREYSVDLTITKADPCVKTLHNALMVGSEVMINDVRFIVSDWAPSPEAIIVTLVTVGVHREGAWEEFVTTLKTRLEQVADPNKIKG